MKSNFFWLPPFALPVVENATRLTMTTGARTNSD